MKIRTFIIIYLILSAGGFIHLGGRLDGAVILLCGPAKSLSYLTTAIAYLNNPDFAVPDRVVDLYKAIGLHLGIWLGGLALVVGFLKVGWRPWIAIVIAWLISVPINLAYEMMQNM